MLWYDNIIFKCENPNTIITPNPTKKLHNIKKSTKFINHII